jgi:hypothetical protein
MLFFFGFFSKFNKLKFNQMKTIIYRIKNKHQVTYTDVFEAFGLFVAAFFAFIYTVKAIGWILSCIG